MTTQEQALPFSYSDEELTEFKNNIDAKLEKAERELDYLKDLEDDPTEEKQQLQQMIVRQETFINHLHEALQRIENKTYGVCRVTGNLIDKERLLKVPHATLSLEAKLDKESQEALANSEKESEKNKAKKAKRKKSGEQSETPHYSDDDLRNFKTLISNKIDSANEELKYLRVVLTDRNRGIKVEDYEDMAPAEVEALIDRQKSFISELESALDRVKKKTYGVCEETGELIPKEILLQHPIIKRLKPTPERASSTINKESETPVRKCRICGCTEDDCHQCIEKTAAPCHWIDTDLCSACEEDAIKESEPETQSAIEDIESENGSVQDDHLLINPGNKIELSEAEKKHLQELDNNLSSNNDNDMNFFQQLAQAGAQNIDLTLRIMQKDNKLTVGIMPSVKSTTLKPVNVTGTAAELDAEFFKTIMPGVAEIKGIITNLEDVKKEVEKKKNEQPAKKEETKPGLQKPAAKKQEKKSGVKKEPKKKEPGKVVGELLKPEADSNSIEASAAAGTGTETITQPELNTGSPAEA